LLAYLAPSLYVQGREWFVEQKELGLQGQRTSDSDPLLLATRKLCWAALVKPRQVYLFQRLSHSAAYHVMWEMLRTEAKGDVFKDVQVGEEDVVLEDIPKGSFLGWDNDVAFAIKIGGIFEGDVPSLWVEQSSHEP